MAAILKGSMRFLLIDELYRVFCPNTVCNISSKSFKPLGRYHGHTLNKGINEKKTLTNHVHLFVSVVASQVSRRCDPSEPASRETMSNQFHTRGVLKVGGEGVEGLFERADISDNKGRASQGRGPAGRYSTLTRWCLLFLP